VEEGGCGGSAVVEEVSVARGEGEAVNLWLKWDGRRIGGSWAAGRHGRREHEGARWHGTLRQRRKRGRGGRLSAWGRTKERGGSGGSAPRGGGERGVAGQASTTRSRGAGGARGLSMRVWAGQGKGGRWAGPQRTSVDFDLK
jgi:hypothetical protein